MNWIPSSTNHRLTWFWILQSWNMLFAQEAQQVQETQQVVVIEVAVQVIRHGSPVAGLTKANFSIVDNGRRQEVLNVETVVWESTGLSSGVDADRQSNARPSDRRHYLLIFDLYFSDRHSLRKAANAALELVQHGLHPQDLVSVALFEPGDGVIIFTGFTDDRPRVIQALKQLSDLTIGKRRRKLSHSLKSQNLEKFDPLLLASNLSDETLPGVRFQPKLEAARVAINDRGGTLLGLKLLKRELAKMAHMVKVGIPDGVSDNTIEMSYSGALLANAFRDIEGRKYMVLLSQGFPNWVLTNDRYGGMVRSHQESMFKVFRQTGWTVHTIDIKGLRPHGANLSQDGLFQMAADTGGKFYKNYNNPGQAFEKLVANTSLIYRLTFSPDRLENDGSYHRIKVKLKDVPMGARIQYARSGYFAPNPGFTSEDFSSAEKAAMILGDEKVDQLQTKAMAQPMYRRGDRVKVAVILEAKGEALLAGHDALELELEAFVYALNDAREIVDFSAQSFSLNLSKNQFMMKRAPRIFANLTLPPGDYELRYLLFNTFTQSFSLDALSLHVPDFQVEVPIFSPPIFPRTFDRAMLVNLRADRFIFEQQDYPYVAGDYLYIPRIDPVLAAKSKQPVVLAIVENSKGKWQFWCRILDESGRVLISAKLKTQRDSAIREGGVYKVLGHLNLKGFSKGAYQFEVKATDTKSKNEIAQTVGFQVGDPTKF